MNPTPKLFALICVVCGLFLLSLNAMADSKSVTAGQNIIESGSSYDDATYYPLAVNAGTYNGTNITLSSSNNDAHAVYESGAGALVKLVNSNITTNGSDARGVFLTASTSIIMTGGTITTTGNENAYGVAAEYAGTVGKLDGVTINTSGTKGIGIAVANGGVVELNRVNINATNIKETALTVYAEGTIFGDHVNIVSTGHGVYVGQTSDVTLNNSQIVTSGSSVAFGANDSFGIYVADTSRFTGTNLTVSTTGNSSWGVYASNNSVVTVTDGTISASGSTATGVFVAEKSSGNLNNVAIKTIGERDSNGAYVANFSTLIVTGGSISTTGSYSYGVYANGTSSATLNNVAVKTEGAWAFGVHAYNSSTLTMTGGNIVTEGEVGHGMELHDNSTVILNNLGITTEEKNGIGICAFNSSTVTMTGGSIATTGSDARGLELFNNSSAIFNNLDITTKGEHAVGANIYSSSTLTMTGGSITTKGDYSHGVVSYEGTVILNDLGISTGGSNSVGLYAAATSQLTGTNLTISTLGDFASGVFVDNSSTASITNGTVSTSGAWAHGIYATGQFTGTGMTVNTSGSSASGVLVVGGKVTITGGMVSTSDSWANGIYVDSSGRFTSTNLKIDTLGDFASGVFVDNNSSAIMTGGTVSTRGYNTNAIYVNNASQFTGTNLTVRTAGDEAKGVYIASGSATLTGGTVSTSGDGAFGVLVDTGCRFAGTDLTIHTTGFGALGALIVGSNFVLDDGTISTNGEGASALFVVANGNVNVTNGNIQTSATNASGIYIASGTVVVNHSSFNVGGDLVTLGGYGQNTVTLDNIRAVNGSNAVTAMESAASALTINNSAIIGDILTGDSSLTNINLNGSTLKGAGTRNDDSVLNINLDNKSLWTMTGDSNLTDLSNNGLIQFKQNGAYKTLTVEGNWIGSGRVGMTVNLSTATIGGTGDGDKIYLTGSSSGSQILAVKNVGGGVRNTALDVVHREGSGDHSESFTLQGGTIDGGAFKYALAKGDAISFDSGATTLDANTWYLYNTGSESSGGSGAKTMVLTPQLMWFAEQDTLLKRMGELRLDEGIFSDKGAHDWQVWVRSYGSQYNVGSKATGTPFNANVYGVDLGADKAWNIDRRNVLYTGVYGGYGSTDQDIHLNGSNGGSDAYLVCAYATWLHDTGWYADLVGKGQYFDNSFDAYDSNGSKTGGDYGQWAAGASLELGRQFQFKDGWYAEPQIQASYAHIWGADYSTSGNIFNVNINGADVGQFRFGSLFGRTIKFENSKQVIQPYVKIFGQEQISSGGEYSTEAGTTRPNLDGLAAVIGCGIVWQLDEVNQLHLDYEAAFSTKYDTPWGFNFGFRHQF